MSNLQEIIDELPEEYQTDFSKWKEKQESVTSRVYVFGESGVGKTFEIKRAQLGTGAEISNLQSTDVDMSVNIENLPPAKFPLTGFEVPILAQVSERIKQVDVRVGDIAGQYNTLDLTNAKALLKIIKNLLGAENAVVIELVADTTRPKTIDALSTNWIPMVEYARNIAKKVERPEFSIYLSKARTCESKVNLDSVINNPEELLTIYPSLSEVIKTINSKFSKTPMVFIGDMDCEREGKRHQSELYLVKDKKKWLQSGIYVGISAPKLIPLVTYLCNEQKASQGTLAVKNLINGQYGLSL